MINAAVPIEIPKIEIPVIQCIACEEDLLTKYFWQNKRLNS